MKEALDNISAYQFIMINRSYFTSTVGCLSHIKLGILFYKEGLSEFVN